MMKRAFTILALLTALTVGSIYAQTGTTVAATIPFQFHVGDRLMPAGEYRLTQNNLGGTTLTSKDDATLRLFLATNSVGNGEESKGSRLEFHRYGDSYFLWRIWSLEEGRQLPKSRAEREVAGIFKHTQFALFRVPLR